MCGPDPIDEGKTVAKRRAKLIISPNTIEFGDEVIVVAHISRVLLGRDRGRQERAGNMLLAGCVVLVLAIAATVEAFQILGAALGAIALVLLIIGLVLRPGRQLSIVTSDGQTTVLIARADRFASDVHAILRQVVNADGPHRQAYEIDVADEHIGQMRLEQGGGGQPIPLETGARAEPQLTSRFEAQRTPRAQTNDPGHLHRASAATGEPERHRQQASPQLGGLTDPRPRTGAPARRPPEGGAHDLARFQQAPNRDTREAAPEPTDAVVPTADQQHPNATRDAPGPGPAGGETASEAAAALAAFDQLMTRIAPQYGNRFGDVQAWLEPVRAYLQSGQGRMAEVQARWSVFAREHMPALAHLPEAGALAARVGRAVGLAV